MFLKLLSVSTATLVAIHLGRKLQTYKSSSISNSPSLDRTATPSTELNLSGEWIKDPDESTSQEEVFDLMKIGQLLRMAVRLVKGIHIQHTEEQIHITVVSAISFLKIKESYSMNGEISKWKRRDLRKGKHDGYVEYAQEKKSLKLTMEWGHPLAGKGVDEYILLSQDKLLVRSTAESNGTTASYDTIYNRCKN